MLMIFSRKNAKADRSVLTLAKNPDPFIYDWLFSRILCCYSTYGGNWHFAVYLGLWRFWALRLRPLTLLWECHISF